MGMGICMGLSVESLRDVEDAVPYGGGKTEQEYVGAGFPGPRAAERRPYSGMGAGKWVRREIGGAMRASRPTDGGVRLVRRKIAAGASPPPTGERDNWCGAPGRRALRKGVLNNCGGLGLQ